MSVSGPQQTLGDYVTKPKTPLKRAVGCDTKVQVWMDGMAQRRTLSLVKLLMVVAAITMPVSPLSYSGFDYWSRAELSARPNNAADGGIGFECRYNT